MTEGGRHGLRIAAWGLVVCLLLYAVQSSAGLKYVQGVIWPSDIYAFQHGIEGPIDVAVLGSSRASFGISPDRMDACIAERSELSTQAVNLARTFATARTAEQLRSDLLGGARTPRVLVLAVGPEFFNEHNHQISESDAANLNLEEAPAALLRARGLRGVLGVLRPLTRGVENIAIFLTRRHETEAHLRWMMLHHGGGQYCYDTDACDDNNDRIGFVLKQRWDTVQQMLIPNVRQERFARFALGSGDVHEGLLDTLRWADEEGIAVVIVKSPLHRTFMEQIPLGVRKKYDAHLKALSQDHGVTVFTPDSARWLTTRSLYIDADHLSAIGSRKLTDELCKKVIAPLLVEGD
ncbi:MAG: hypothetical protein ACI8S6_001513 [Myxococcota bacterium]|jgi:hypothetical protein